MYASYLTGRGTTGFTTSSGIIESLQNRNQIYCQDSRLSRLRRVTQLDLFFLAH